MSNFFTEKSNPYHINNLIHENLENIYVIVSKIGQEITRKKI